MTNRPSLQVVGAILLQTVTLFGATSLLGVEKDRQAFDRDVAYWRSFDVYRSKVKSEEKANRDALRAVIKLKASTIESESRANRLLALQRSEAEYRLALERDSRGASADQSMINLIQTLVAKAEIATDKGSEEAEIMRLIRGHESQFATSKNASIRMLLETRYLLLTDRAKKAEKVMTRIVKASDDSNPEVLVYANMMLGDSAFSAERSEEAMKYFEDALAIIEKSPVGLDFDHQRLMIIYRLAWATYRAAKLEQGIGYARQILISPERFSSDAELRKIRQDASDILGNSLFELDNESITAEYLKMPSLKKAAPQVVSTIIRRYLDAGLDNEALEFIDKSLKLYSQPIDYPYWLTVKIDAATKLKRAETVISAQEDLVALGSPQHPWRKKHSDQSMYIDAIERTVPELGQEAIQALLKRGREGGANTDLNRALSMSQILVSSFPAHSLKISWMAAGAEALYHLGRIAESCSRFDQIIGNFKVSKSQLDHLMYQRAQCAERQLVLAVNKDQSNATQINRSIAELEDHANAYANRFPSRERTNDILLIVASALRDSGRIQSARKYWERVLLAKSSPGQRALAVRGIVYADLQEKNSKAVVEQVERFLAIEDWKKLGEPLRNELLGILAQSTLDAGSQLAKQGNMHAAGIRMLKSAALIKDLPERERIYRDGAYILAVAGDWDSALAASLDYQKQRYKKFDADMKYLEARSREYQLNFAEAAKVYFEFALKYPNHAKSTASLERSEQLAFAEANPKLAGASAEELARRESLLSSKLRSLERSFTYYLDAREFDRARKISATYQSIAKVPEDKLNAKLMKARTSVAADRLSDAVNELQSLETSYLQNKTSMKRDRWLLGRGHTHLLLASVYRRQFEEKISDESPSKDVTAIFDRSIRSFDIAINSGDTSVTSQARYEAGSICDEFVAYLSRTKVAKSENSVSDRVAKLGAKYHSENLIARHKNPERYRQNKWVGLSALRMNHPKLATIRGDSAPMALSTDLPSQWSIE
jgi:tetratricopeptide (TPR) repeat protein